MQQLRVKVGIDAGGVLIARMTGPNGSDTFFSDRYLDTPPVDGAFEAVAKLVELYGADNIFIISKCGAQVQNKTLEWLNNLKFYDTGFKKSNIHFCRERPQKAPIAAKLKLTHFIDDRPEVLSYMNTVPFLMHLGQVSEVAEQVGSQDYLSLARILTFPNWKAIMEFLAKGD